MDETEANTLNDMLSEIWAKPSYRNLIETYPVYFREIKKGGLMFVGMNPSFSPKRISGVLRDNDCVNLSIDPECYFNYPNEDFDICVSNQIDTAMEKDYPFFKQHKKLANELENHWGHLDLFQYRKTSQKDFLKIVTENNLVLNEFGIEQFELFRSALVKSEANLIIIANATASKIFKAEMSLGELKDDGTYALKLKDKTVPVFLSGMLTGGRALDVQSRERLFWHIKKVYDSL